MTLTQLKWLAVLGPVGFVAVLEYGAYVLYPALLSWPGRWVMAGVVVMAMYFFYAAIFRTLGEIQDTLQRQNRELLTLHRATLDIYGELSLDAILQKVVDQACILLNARYGAIAVICEEGKVEQFVTSGISEEERAEIGDPPQGHGLLGIVLRQGERLRLPDLKEHPCSAGFPANHPSMSSLLAVPIICKSHFRGNLYLAEKASQAEFSPGDEETLVRFATQAAIAIDNADLHQQLRSLAVSEERARIAREMHDGMAQVLAYVNTKAQAVREYLRSERTQEAREQLEQLAGAAREVYADIREGILALRTTPGEGESLSQVLPRFLEQWQDQSGISVESRVDTDLNLSSEVELQVLRILQEALSNVRKHSGAERSQVEVRRNGDTVVAMVEDEGAGFDPATAGQGRTPRFGIAVMKERAESIGGEILVDSSPGHGTRVRIELPAAS